MDAMEFVVEKQLKSLLLDEDPTKIEFLHQKMMWNNWANGRASGPYGGYVRRCTKCNKIEQQARRDACYFYAENCPE